MKPSSILIKYFQRQSAIISNLIQKPMPEFRPEDFHLLRVHIKRVKAIFSLTAFCVEGFDQQKYFKPYKAIFRQAGSVRELQLQESLMKKYKPDHALAGYYHLLRSDIFCEQNAFFSLADKKLKSKLKKNVKSVACFMKNVDTRGIKEFLLEKRNQIDSLFHVEKPEASQVHELRKSIKEIYYVQKIFQPKNKRLFIADDFQELLGLWHDHDVISNDLLKDAQNHKLKPDEVKAIMAVQKKISRRASQLFNTIEAAKAKIMIAQS